jgi:hypothetical protein
MPEMEVFSVQLPGSNNDVRLSNLEPKQSRYFMVKTVVHVFVHPCSTTRLWHVSTTNIAISSILN